MSVSNTLNEKKQRDRVNYYNIFSTLLVSSSNAYDVKRNRKIELFITITNVLYI